MTWEPELEELRQRQALAREMGGPDKIARQRAAGRLTVRERIGTLLDSGSFHEIGSITGNGTYDEAGALPWLATISPCAAARPTLRSSRSRSRPNRWRTNCACR